MISPSLLYKSPSALAPHYSRFRVGERLLLTGHSHQAWPDVGFEAQSKAWLDAAQHVDEKWERASEEADHVRAGWRRLLGDSDGEIALGHNTHELVTRLLSGLALRRRPKLVSTDAEFHTIRRQLDRLGEEGLEIVRVAGRPVETVARRLAAEVDDRTAAVLVSSVFYASAAIVPHLDEVAAACEHHGSALLIDAYHHLNVVPFDIHAMRLDSAFVTGGGYKYCQLGEGNAFLRTPARCALRPVLTGWFSEFEALEQGVPRQGVPYPSGPARFAGATYDPVSHYRAAAVFEFHRSQGMTPDLLREVNQHQIGLLIQGIERLDMPPSLAAIEPMPLDRRAGFLALRSPIAAQLHGDLRKREVRTDYRGDVLRIGPAPYLTDEQLREFIARLAEVANQRPA